MSSLRWGLYIISLCLGLYEWRSVKPVPILNDLEMSAAYVCESSLSILMASEYGTTPLGTSFIVVDAILIKAVC